MTNSRIDPLWLHSVHHDGSIKYVSNPYPELGEKVAIRLRIGEQVPVQEVLIRTFPDGEQEFSTMTRRSNAAPCQWWEGSIEISQPDVHYRFLIRTKNKLWWYSAAGVTGDIPLDYTDFRLLAGYNFISWLQTAVFYQVFPDRFANGNSETDPHLGDFEYKGHGPKTFPWATPPPEDHPFPIVFYGGDLPGISGHIDHLDSLGVNALYLNPIFAARSNHKYDVTDYKEIDPHLGGNNSLAQLRQDLDQRGMHYILDIVPNHCGYWHPWFQKAQSDPLSPEVDFFTFEHHPDEYASWLGVWTLPKLNYKSRELRRLMYEDEDSIFKHWLLPPYSADGWRVDVANMLGRQGETQLGTEIVSGIRQAVKSTHPNAYLIGENFFDATPQLQGDQWDGIMNYTGLTLPLWYWLDIYQEWAHSLRRHITSASAMSTAAMVKTWECRQAAIPWVISLQQFNILGSHDTPRIKSTVKHNDALVRLAAVVQFTFPGIPCIYYGDEIGMSDDPILESRGCMLWDQDRWDQDLLAFYKSIISLRKNSPALLRGGFQILLVEEDTVTYQRESETEHILVVAHRGKTTLKNMSVPISRGGVADGRRFREYFSGHELIVSQSTLTIPLVPQGATIWIDNDS